MGNFYVNFSVKSAEQAPVVNVLKQAGCRAFVTPPANGCVVVFEEESDNQDPSAIERVGTLLSRDLEATVLGVLNHDDDVLCYWLFEHGKVTDTYNSDPDYFGEGEEAAAGGDAPRLCAAWGASKAADQVESVLRGEEYVFALERHAALVQTLGIPEWTVGAGFRYLEQGETPEEISEERLARVNC